ncbi:MAG: glutamate racemase [Bacteroidetes bacterium]|nr:MAG: glutamate racemase [Bacteroidota bacterium]
MSVIGIFDSGIGGLTVAAGLKNLVPNIKIVFFGDTINLPYGEKNNEQIIAYTKKAIDFFLEKQCKLILIACNTASVAAYPIAKKYVGKKAKLFNVVDPVVDFVEKNFPNNKIGLIGTSLTIHSAVYEQKFLDKKSKINLQSLATPEFASMIEYGFYKDQLDYKLIHQYLHHPKFEKIDTLILACTHYSLIKNYVAQCFDYQVEIVDSSQIMAEYVRQYLGIQDNTDIKPTDEFYVSKISESFEQTVKLLFEKNISVSFLSF